MWNRFVDLWNSLGWAANLIGIVSGLIVSLLFIYRLIKNKHNLNLFTYKNLSDLVKDRVPNNNYVKQEILKSSRVAVIDDNPTDFPLDYLRDSGFSIEVYEKVSLSDYQKFSKYDLVMLDIAGVVLEDLNEGGLELIKRISSVDNCPLIIAVSSKKFDPRAAEFFSIADEVISKPLREKECEEAIVGLLMQKLSPVAASEEVDRLISSSNIDRRGVIYLYKTLFKYSYGMLDRKSSRRLLLKRYAFMDVEKILNKVEIIKKFMRD